MWRLYVAKRNYVRPDKLTAVSFLVQVQRRRAFNVVMLYISLYRSYGIYIPYTLTVVFYYYPSRKLDRRRYYILIHRYIYLPATQPVCTIIYYNYNRGDVFEF